MWNKEVNPEDLTELPPTARKIFLQYYDISDGKIGHPADRQRFNEFIRWCHAKRIKLTGSDFERMLIRIGCPEDKAIRLADIYHNGRELLKCQCP